MAQGDEFFDIHEVLSDVETCEVEIHETGLLAFRLQVDLQGELCDAGADCGLTDRVREQDMGRVAISASCYRCVSPDRPRKAVAATLRELKYESRHPNSEFKYVEKQTADQKVLHLIPWESLNALMPGRANTITRTLGALRRAARHYSVAGPTPQERTAPYSEALTVEVQLWRASGSHSSLFVVAEQAGAMLADSDFRDNLYDMGPVGHQLLDLLLERLQDDGYYTPATEDNLPQA